MKRISQYAKEHDLRLHLDGARLYIASAYTRIPPAQYAALVETIYISLYKYLGAASGAILAGPKRVIEQVAHDRKVFGATVFQAWPFAAVALHHLDGFGERYGRAVAVARDLFSRLQANGRFRIESFPHGTNIQRLTVDGVDGERYRAALESRGVSIRPPGKESESSSFLLRVNESLNRKAAPDLAKTFIDALALAN